MPNSDQLFSLLRQILTALSAFAIAHGWYAEDVSQMILAGVPAAASFVWGLWANVDNAKDMVFSGMRNLLVAVGVFAAARGWITAETVQSLTGIMTAILSSVLSMWFYRNEPGPNLPGTTVVDPAPRIP